MKLELARQKLELVVPPEPSAGRAIASVQSCLSWLYLAAQKLGAYPLQVPEIDFDGPLLWVQESRDEVWVELDGRPALEELCRCSSVQFTVDVNPADAIGIINRLWDAKLNEGDYAPNNQRFTAYIEQSTAAYDSLRYGGPAGFTDMQDYVQQLLRHDVVMHQGTPCKLRPDTVAGLDVDLYLRSVWWHYRLRRYGNSLALEMRPFARRADAAIDMVWLRIQDAVGF